MSKELAQDDQQYCGTVLKTQMTLESRVGSITTFRIVPLEMLCRPMKSKTDVQLLYGQGVGETSVV